MGVAVGSGADCRVAQQLARGQDDGPDRELDRGRFTHSLLQRLTQLSLMAVPLPLNQTRSRRGFSVSVLTTLTWDTLLERTF